MPSRCSGRGRTSCSTRVAPPRSPMTASRSPRRSTRGSLRELGAQLVKESPPRPTTSPVTAPHRHRARSAMVKIGMRNVAAVQPDGRQNGIEKAVTAAVESIQSQAKDVEDKSDIANVATISAPTARRRGHRRRIDRSEGRCGHRRESNTFGTELEFTEGMLDKGYFRRTSSPTRSVRSGPRRPYICSTRADLDGAFAAPRARRRHETASRWSSSPKTSRARRSPRWWSTRSVARPSGRRQAPCFGDRRKRAPGHGRAHVVRSSRGRRAQARKRHADLLGQVKRVIVTKDNTTLVDGGGTEDDSRPISQIKRRSEPDSDWDRENPGRLASCRGVAVHQGRRGHRVELKEKKHRIEDAVSSVRARSRRVWSPGWTALIRARPAGSGRRRQRPVTSRPAPSWSGSR